MANSRTVYVIHAADGKQHLGYLQQILEALKKEDRIDTHVGVESDSVTKDTFKGIGEDDMMIMLLTDDIVPIQDNIEEWLVGVKKGKLVEVLIDKHTYHLDFKVFPDSFEAIRGTEDMDRVWQQIGGSLREVFPVREEVDPPVLWKKWIPYVAGALILGALTYFLVPIMIKGPNADFSYRVLDPVKGDVISGVSECYLPCKVLLNSRATNYDTLQWELNDTIIKNEEEPEHVFIESGDYNIVLTAFKGKKESTFIDTLTIKAPPYASFELINNGCTAPCEIEFKNTSKNATKYKWAFTTGTSPRVAENANPGKRKYNTHGTYNVQLFIENEDGVKADTLQQVTILKDNTPFPEFKATKIAGNFTSMQTFRFTNLSKNGTAYVWNFGDGSLPVTTTNMQTVNHLFTGHKTFYVTLKVIGADGVGYERVHPVSVRNRFYIDKIKAYNVETLNKVMKPVNRINFN